MKRVKVIDDADWDTLSIRNENCLMCGCKIVFGNKKGNNKSKHHAILKYLRPKKNVMIYLCNECHRKHHERCKMEVK